MSENANNANELNNPHDKFFKGAFSMLVVTKPLLIEFLPKDLLDKLDLDSLEIDPNSYINDELKETFSDMVWSCRLKDSQKQRKIAFLFEHKSYKPAYPHFQINDYQRNSWKMQIEAGLKPVPVLPIVLYHGIDKWIVEPFESYFGEVEAEMLRFLPCFDYILINLQDYSDEYIKKLQSVFLQKTLLAFKHYLDKQYIMLNFVGLLFEDFTTKNDSVRSFILKIDVYLRAVSGVTREKRLELIHKSDNNLKPEIMTIFDEIEELIAGQITERVTKRVTEQVMKQGLEQGLEQGAYNEKKRMVILLYKKRKTAKSIAEYVDLSVDQIKAIIVEYVKDQNKAQSN